MCFVKPVFFLEQSRGMELLKKLFETSPLGLSLQDSNLRFLRLNSVLAQINGLSIEEHLGKTVREIIPQLADTVEPLMQEVLETGVTLTNIEIKGHTFADSDQLRHWLATYYPVNLENGERGVGCIITEITELKNTQKSMRQSQARLQYLLTSSPAVIFCCTPQDDYRATFMSENVRDILGYEAQEFLDDPLFWLNHVHPDDRKPVLDNLPTVLKTGFYCHEYRFLHSDGIYHWFYAQLRLIRDKKGDPKECVGYWVDISDRKLAEIRQLQLQEKLEAALSEEQQLANITLKSINDGVIITNATGEIISLNPKAEILTNWKTQEARGKPASEVLILVDEIDGRILDNPIDYILAENSQPQSTSLQVLVASNGTKHPVETSVSLIWDEKNHSIRGAVVVIRDVTQSRNLTKKLSWQANHDALTGLINRQYFEEKLGQAVEGIRNENHHHVLCYLDLDQFKIVNDTCGHLAGDELLRQVIEIMQSKIRAVDSLARLGGDEFGILLYQCPLEEAISITEEIRQSIYDFRFIWQEKSFRIGVSIGLVELNSYISDLSIILNSADAACYHAKDKGGNRLEIYQPDSLALMNQKQQRGWSLRLRQALDLDQFCLLRQAIVPNFLKTSSNKIETAYEILVRMVSESGELISPGVFLPAAERYNLIVELDRWVIEKSFALLAQCPTESTVHFINLSGKSLDDEQFLSFLAKQFKGFKIFPQQICFEITETAAIANLNQAREFIKTLQKWGCQLALDDFGRGMSSFGYLKELPVNFIKIDGSFIKDIVKDRATYAMVEAIHHVAKVMGLQTIAEFVENEAIIEKLAEIGVDYLQGYGIRMPEVWKLEVNDVNYLY